MLAVMKQEDFLYMEDIAVGQKFTAGPMTMTEADIIAFAKEFDPQDFHVDAVAAKDTTFGELVASGWHTAAITMKMVVDAVPKMKGGMIGRGAEKMMWPRPVKPGDTLSYVGEILEIMPSKTNPKRATLRIKNTTLNQDGKPVMEMETLVLIPRK